MDLHQFVLINMKDTSDTWGGLTWEMHYEITVLTVEMKETPLLLVKAKMNRLSAISGRRITFKVMRAYVLWAVINNTDSGDLKSR